MQKDGEVVSDFDALHAAVKASARGTLVGVDVAGILLAIKAPKPSRKDMFMSLIITDGRPNSFGAARRLSVNIFAASAQAFPQPENIGDLVYLQNARVSLFQNAPQATLSLHKNNLISIIARSVRDPSHESEANDTERAAARRKMRLRGGVPSGLVSVAGKAKCQPPSNFAETLERLRIVSDAVLADQSLQSATGTAMETLPRLANAVCPGNKAGYFFDHILVRVMARGPEQEGSPSFQITDASLAPSSALLRMVSQRCVNSSALREIPNGCWMLLYNVQKYREDDDKLVLTWIQDRSMGLRVSHLGRTREGKEIEFREVTRAEAIIDAADFMRLPSSASTSSKDVKLLKTSDVDPGHAGSGPSSSSSSSSSSMISPSESSRRMSCVAGLIREVGADVGPLRASPRLTLMAQSQTWHLEARVTAIFPPLARISALLAADRIKPGHDLMLRFEDSTGVLEVLFAIEDLMAIFESGKKVSSLDASFASWTPDYLGRMLVPGVMSDFVLSLA